MELPHWLIIGGTVLVMTGFFGLALSRDRRAATGPVSGPISPRSQLPPIPSLLDSSPREQGRSEG